MLLDPRIAVAEAPLGGEPPDLPADEALSIVNAVPRRYLEFATGRECARRAMAALGHATASIPRAQDRVRMWPDDLVGSITHTELWAATSTPKPEHFPPAIKRSRPPSTFMIGSSDDSLSQRGILQVQWL